MSTHHSLREEPLQPAEEVVQPLGLCRGAGVGRTALCVEPALVADADGAAVVGTAVGAHFEQAAVLGQGSVATDVEVIAHGAEAAGTVVVKQLLGGIVLRAAGGGAVEYKEAHAVGALHQLAVLHPGEEGALGGHLLAADGHRVTVVGHDRKGIKGEQLVTPSAVRAAMAAWMMAFTMEVQVIFWVVVFDIISGKWLVVSD